jgi:hypothetical protein
MFLIVEEKDKMNSTPLRYNQTTQQKERKRESYDSFVVFWWTESHQSTFIFLYMSEGLFFLRVIRKEEKM